MCWTGDGAVLGRIHGGAAPECVVEAAFPRGAGLEVTGSDLRLNQRDCLYRRLEAPSYRLGPHLDPVLRIQGIEDALVSDKVRDSLHDEGRRVRSWLDRPRRAIGIAVGLVDLRPCGIGRRHRDSPVHHETAHVAGTESGLRRIVRPVHVVVDVYPVRPRVGRGGRVCRTRKREDSEDA